MSAEEVRLRPRGIGLDTTPGCFICGGELGLHNNIAAFVASKAQGELAVSFFERGARLDYRDFEPNWIQVKIGSCDSHLPALEKLFEIMMHRPISKEVVSGLLAEERSAANGR